MAEDITEFHRELGAISATLKSIEKEITFSNDRISKIHDAFWKKLEKLHKVDDETNKRITKINEETHKKIDEHISAYDAEMKLTKFKIKLLAILMFVFVFSAGAASSDFLKRALLGLF
ncbi:MAG: hypothetical protein COV43_04400 [Deltaproteobacteria bacterium CG11_big_fil_rev_8_21_14_0_20_42_23]|nr:MAG: hypothetical protein COV43_04400 [Deltaproteobacteria bacterium CG11_big_fil_rev_8_21_14_0_20_42_23]PJC65015.1 MAG: hypothetical protein CO021_00790 [Deltaproteobacteria bacterium CG_4_9_14_0_2_um_filter_42_21]